MRIPKRVNAALDWAEKHFGALAVVVTLVAAAAAALLAPPVIGLPAAGLIIGLAIGGFAVHMRMVKRIARVRAEVDDLLRENGALRHRNTVLSSGVITRESQVTQALVAIPEEPPEDDPLRTAQLPGIPDEAGGPGHRTQPVDDARPANDGAPSTGGAPPAGRPANETRSPNRTQPLDDDLLEALQPESKDDGDGAAKSGKSLETGGNKTVSTGGNKTVGYKPGGAKPGGNKPGGAKRAGGKSAGGKSGAGKPAGPKARASGNPKGPHA
ncbi:hypothetical protein ACGFNU_31680 [Spirillospora sp. NPDC048911]|uniref:hypothetical protein n=1 Tax=Spirillospora sp. NPDC048911 TaxID=3364527 RepID=UPI003717F7F6